MGPALWAAGDGRARVLAKRPPAAHGRAADGRRLLPCTVIDVAGLVPGAYQGRGRGNQFLADLCTADVLIHVVDASGLTDEGGNLNDRAFAAAEEVTQAGEEAADAAVAREVEWVAEEVHNWVFENLRHKRAGWRKRRRASSACSRAVRARYLPLPPIPPTGRARALLTRRAAARRLLARARGGRTRARAARSTRRWGGRALHVDDAACLALRAAPTTRTCTRSSRTLSRRAGPSASRSASATRRAPPPRRRRAPPPPGAHGGLGAERVALLAARGAGACEYTEGGAVAVAVAGGGGDAAGDVWRAARAAGLWPHRHARGALGSLRPPTLCFPASLATLEPCGKARPSWRPRRCTIAQLAVLDRRRRGRGVQARLAAAAER